VLSVVSAVVNRSGSNGLKDRTSHSILQVHTMFRAIVRRRGLDCTSEDSITSSMSAPFMHQCC